MRRYLQVVLQRPDQSLLRRYKYCFLSLCGFSMKFDGINSSFLEDITLSNRDERLLFVCQFDPISLYAYVPTWCVFNPYLHYSSVNGYILQKSVFNSALKHSAAVRRDLDTFAEGPTTTPAALQGLDPIIHFQSC